VTLRPPMPDPTAADPGELTQSLVHLLAARPEEVAETIASLHRPVRDEDGLADLLHHAAATAVAWMPDVDWAGITVQFDGVPFTAASTDPRVLAVDEAQYSLGDGPCMLALRSRSIVAVTPDEMHVRWPELAVNAQAQGVHSFLAAPLVDGQRARGSINLYSASTTGFTVGEADFLAVLSAFVSRGLGDFATLRTAGEQARQLREAMGSRAPIEQAKGILMAAHQIDSDAAFEMLRVQSQRSNTKLRDVAADFVSAHTRNPATPVGEVGGHDSVSDFHSAFDHAPIGMALADLAGHLLLVNPALQRLLHRPVGEPAGGSLLEYVHPDDRVRARLALETVVGAGQFATRVQLRMARGDSSVVHALVSASVVLDGGNQPARLVVHVEDVDELVARGEELARRTEELERRTAELVRRVLHDTLTGLPNRALFLDRLARAVARHRRSGEALAVLCCDVDGLKEVNDLHGHAEGDTVLEVLGQRLAALLRPGDTAARLGGDEFALLCEDAGGDAAADVADRVCTAMAEPIQVSGQRLQVSVTVGSATSATHPEADHEQLLHAADAAMYQAKRERRGSAATCRDMS